MTDRLKLNKFRKTVSSIAKEVDSMPLQPATFFIPSIKKPRILAIMFVTAFASVLFLTLLQLVLQKSELARFGIIFFDHSSFIFLDVLAIFGFLEFKRKRLMQYSVKKAFWYAWAVSVIFSAVFSVVANVLVSVMGLIPFNRELTFAQALLNMLLSAIVAYMLFKYLLLQFELTQKQFGLLVQHANKIEARIKPHFFFNALNTLLYLVESRPSEATVLVEDLAALYRASFAEAKEIPLQKEIEVCKKYLNIEQIRIGDKLTVTWQLPSEDELYDMVIVSMVLQSVIEDTLLLISSLNFDVIELHVDVTWLDDMVNIDIWVATAKIAESYLLRTAEKQLNSEKLMTYQLNLQQFFGKQAMVKTDSNPAQFKTTIRYPLADAALE